MSIDKKRLENTTHFILQYLQEQREKHPEPEDSSRVQKQLAKRLAWLDAERREKEDVKNADEP